ncbi:MAG: hypothetical protein NC084_09290 [Bacteroides sp.]|nr:hypothetical protein [Eubacterium sp.]MCM1418843.1 hypothetical protein [Roseburia sp.]MCM1462890.1 hypothetical protein [Bacteroides sp.]
MKKFIRIPYEEESRFPLERLSARLDREIAAQQKRSLYKLKGEPLFLLLKKGEEYTLRYYHSYKKDFCDTCLRFTLVPGLERSGVKGSFRKPFGSWAFFWGVIATLLIDFIVITYCFLFTSGFSLETALMISGTAILVRAYVCVSLMQFNAERLKMLKNEMLRLLREEETDEDDQNEEGAESDERD